MPVTYYPHTTLLRWPGGGRQRGADRGTAGETAVARARGDQADGEAGRGMGQTTAETVKEIEATRSRLDSEFRGLEARLPAPAVWVKRLVGLAVGGGLDRTSHRLNSSH